MFAPLAAVVRNGLPESWHFGAVAAVTPEGRLVAFQGDPQTATFLRSAAKPFQCLPLLLAGAAERFGLTAADVALICASHGGTPEHTRRAADLLARGGFGGEDLLCGAHWPLDPQAAEALRQQGEAPTPLHNNCSGKHAGMLLACRLLGLPVADYVAPHHPWQQRILEHVAGCCGLPPESIGQAVDGCSVPTYHVPLAAAARGYAALADPRAAGLTPDVSAAMDAVVHAMTGEPAMVAGPGRFTTRLMAATGGRVLGKEGAEGLYGLAVRGPVALGVAIKIADGGERCRDGVVLDVLRQLGSLAGAELAELEDLHHPVLHNHRGLRVGEVRPEVDLEEV
ncbi:MAG TPA: asparaginase [Thermoanaerobaculia bacterium]|nr:asparaginase [Thermoanaerobaculia bacterium]